MFKRLQRSDYEMILAMIIFGTLAPFVRNVATSSATIAFSRTLLGAIVLQIMLLFKRQTHSLAKGERKLMVLSAAELAGNWIFLFESYRYVSVSIATMLYYTAPILALLLSFIFFHEPLTKRQIGCFILTLIGCILISWQPQSAFNLRGVIMGLCAAFCYAMILLLQRFRKPMPGLLLTSWQLSIAAILLGIYLVISKDTTMLHISLAQLPWLLCIGIVHTALAYYLYFHALAHLALARSALYSYLDPLTAILLSFLILQESCTGMQGSGIVLLFSAMLLYSYQK